MNDIYWILNFVVISYKPSSNEFKNMTSFIIFSWMSLLKCQRIWSVFITG